MTLTLAVRVPVAAGVNLTVMVQLPPAAMELPQLLVCAKSPRLVPVMEIPEIPTDVFPVFVMTIVSGAEVDDTFVLGKEREAGAKLTAIVVPEPERVTTCGDPGPSSVKESVPDAVIAVCGVNVTLTVQEADGARVAPQVWAEIVK